MAGNGGDYYFDLTTDPIFEDAVYRAEVLGLPDNEDEDALDEQLAMSAKESGIADPYRLLNPEAQDLSTAISTLTALSEHRSSMSIHSRESQSTAMTSHPSRTSKENPSLEPSPTVRTPPPFTRPSLSLEYYDAVMDRFRPSIGHRHSSSNASGATSVLSTTSSLPVLSKLATARKPKRTSSLFSMFRKDSSTCPSRSRHGHHVKPLSPKLDCGHSLSKYAIRVHIQEALDRKEHMAPNCCGKALPRSILETVLSKEETDIVMADDLQSPVAVYDLQQDSGYSEDGMSSIDLPHSPGTQSHPTGSFVTTPGTPNRELTQEGEDFLTSVLADETFKSLRAQQKEQFRRVAAFESTQRKALSTYHQWTLTRLASQLETTKSERMKQHVLDLERLDEFQIVAEHDLRKSHDQETQNVATALKYMEAYCSGSNPTNPDTAHIVTEEDRKKLARQYLIQQKLPGKHESAINVLRAKQEKNTKLKLQKQQTELQQLDADHEREKGAEELHHVKNLTRLESLIESRRRKIMSRWDLRFEIWRRDWNSQHGTTLSGNLPHEEWPNLADIEDPVDESSSLALYLLVMR
ncbi:uncharacterized protein BDR25DRAFT_69500 [Lindgomyces ingoldianus]|uniref:Uncharacterized protein n=1 Tax=Lindgomyces ingoldianus TaxID=673940 RepID=A0ACB6QJZ9_9PLEO|nr:uncharacterized protein BDR25DRAFT_69500 [Lindgomyces ingoldianus]KAF2467192.1 hypothetical protein BDR25DRAFT_69500 [Lindgomyces ingoldianus]